MSERKVPKLRFAGFTDDWKQRKLGDIGEKFIGGGTPSTNNSDFWNGKIAWIQSSDLTDSSIHNIQIRKKISKKALDNSPAKLINENSIAIVTRVGVGKVALVPFKYATSQDFLSISHLNIDELFASYTISRLMQIESLSTQGTSIKGITKDVLLEKLIFIPPTKAEQQAIGEFFKQLDDTIAFHQREWKKYKNLKISYLEKMFPQENENKPQLRFPNFTDAWKQRKLGEIGETYSGLSGKTKDDFGKGSAKYITYMNVFSNAIIDKNMVDLIEVDDKQNCVKKGDVLFTTSSETPQEVGMSSVCCDDMPNLYLNSFCFGYRPNIEIDLNFLAYVLRSNTIRSQMVLLAQGISRYNISKKGVMNIEVPLPELAEQQAIGEFFKQLDDTIAFHQRTQKKYQNLKKSYLEKMFAKINYAWKQRKLGEVVFQIKSYSLSRNVETNKDTGFKYVHYGDIHRNIAKLLSSENNLPSIQKGNYEFLQKGDLVIADASEDYEGIGNSCLIDCFLSRNIVAGLHTIALRPTEVNSLFLYYLLHTDIFSQYGKVIATGTKVFGITAKNLLNFEFNLPSEAEQQAIGEFFRQLDDTIAFHQRTQKKYQNLKKSYLEKMFAKINYAWKQRKLGEITEKVERKAPENSNAPVMMISASSGFINQSEKYSTNNAGSSLAKYTLLKFGELAYNHGFSKLRNFGSCFDLKVKEARIPFVYHSFSLPNDDPKFFATYLNSGIFDKDLKKLVSSSARMDGLLNISYEQYMSLDIFVPTLPEQQAIGEFFRQLDDTIAFHQRELEKYQQLKQVLLDQLFV